MRTCEHCGSMCHLAPVCGRCGQQHKPEFFQEAALDKRTNSNFWILMAIQLPIWYVLGQILDIQYLLGFFVWSVVFLISVLVTALISYQMAKKYKPKRITLKNGRTITI